MLGLSSLFEFLEWTPNDTTAILLASDDTVTHTIRHFLHVSLIDLGHEFLDAAGAQTC